MSHQEHFFPEGMPAVFTSSKSTVKLSRFNIVHRVFVVLIAVSLPQSRGDSFRVHCVYNIAQGKNTRRCGKLTVMTE